MTGRWIGLREANAALKNLPEHVRMRVQKTLDTTAFQVARAAERRAPRATGTLARSIGWKSNPRWLNAVVGVDKSAAFYWKFFEYGTVKMQARPMFRPAAESMSADHDQRMMQDLERALAEMEREARV